MRGASGDLPCASGKFPFLAIGTRGVPSSIPNRLIDRRDLGRVYLVSRVQFKV